MQYDKAFGRVPSTTTRWQCRKTVAKEGGGEDWAVMLAESGDGGAGKVSDFPIQVLSLDAIRDAWGPGRYRLTYFGDNAKGAMVKVGSCTAFEITAAQNSAAPSIAAAPVPPPPPPPPPAIAESMTMIQMASLLADRQINMVQMLATQQVEFVREHSRSTMAQMGQHYAAMIRVQRQNEAPPPWAQQLQRQVADLYEEETPEPAAATLTAPNDVPLGGMVTADGRLSIPHAVQALGPRALDILADLIAKAKTEPQPTPAP